MLSVHDALGPDIPSVRIMSDSLDALLVRCIGADGVEYPSSSDQEGKSQMSYEGTKMTSTVGREVSYSHLLRR